MEHKCLHIVRIHPVEGGQPNLHKVKKELDFNTLKEAQDAVQLWNDSVTNTQAVYFGVQ